MSSAEVIIEEADIDISGVVIVIPDAPVSGGGGSNTTSNSTEFWITIEGIMDNVVDLFPTFLLAGFNKTINIFDQDLNKSDDVIFNSLNLSTNLNASGNVTATFFFGNGSQLTDIIAASTNIFDQDLNTTNDVKFRNITASNISATFYNILARSVPPNALTFNNNTVSFNSAQINITDLKNVLENPPALEDESPLRYNATSHKWEARPAASIEPVPSPTLFANSSNKQYSSTITNVHNVTVSGSMDGKILDIEACGFLVDPFGSSLPLGSWTVRILNKSDDTIAVGGQINTMADIAFLPHRMSWCLTATDRFPVEDANYYLRLTEVSGTLNIAVEEMQVEVHIK